MKVYALFFSPTLTTKKVVEAVAEGLACGKNGGAEHGGTAASAEVVSIDVTTPKLREREIRFEAGDVVVFGVPVYIGRVPNLLRDFFASIRGNGALGVPVVVYGHRAYDDALLELKDIMTAGGFNCIAAAAFIGEHSFSTTLGGGRPDLEDLRVAEDFGRRIAEKTASGEICKEAKTDFPEIKVPGNFPYRFFAAKDRDNKGIDIRKVKPETDMKLCGECGVCAEICPMGAIDPLDCKSVTGICIKCGACIKRCPGGAKHFTDPTYLEHKRILEENFTSPRKEPELFV